MAKYFTILIICIFSFSCQSPWDIDTPRNIILPKPMDSVALSLVTFHIEENGIVEQFVIENAILEIDTVSNTPLVWGLLSLNFASVINYEAKKLGLSSITFYLNNIAVAGNTVTLNSTTTPNSYAKYLIRRGINSGYDTTIFSDPINNTTDIAFSLDKEKKELWIYLDAKIYDKRYSVDSYGTGNIFQSPDSLFIKTRLHFNY